MDLGPFLLIFEEYLLDELKEMPKEHIPQLFWPEIEKELYG